jgi:hypothetical protein
VAQVSFDSDQLLQQLTGDTEQAVEKLAGRSQDKQDVEQRFSDIEKQMEEAAKIKDKSQRDVRMKVLEADLEVLRKDADQEEKDLAQAVFGLNAMLERMGKEYSNLNQPSPEGQADIAEAEAEVKEDEAKLIRAQSAWFFKERAIARAQEEIEESKQQLEDVKVQVQREARQRLMQADIETSLQEFMVRVEKTIIIMESRKTQIEAQLRGVTMKKQQAFQVKEQAARALEQLDQQLNDAEARLKEEEEMLSSLVNGTQEHAAQTQKISDSRAAVEDLRGKRNTAFVLFQSKEKFASELEVHERTQMKLRDNQRMWITALRSDTEERVVTFRSRLEAMKAMADQDIAKQLDDLGAEVDQRNVEYMARAGAVSDELRMKRMEKHPQRIADIAAARAAQAEAIQRIRERELVMIQQFKEQYGIDPTASSFFHYEGEGAGNAKGTA